MDAFESLVGSILQGDGYWIWPSYKVELTKAEKYRIGRHSSPRWEIDLVAYKAKGNRVLAIECKSFLDSFGVLCCSFGSGGVGSQRYKLFNDKILRETVLTRPGKQLVASGLCRARPVIQLCLVAGKIKTDRDRTALSE